MKFNRRKHEVLHQGKNYPMYCQRFGPATLETSVPEKDLRVLMDSVIMSKPAVWCCDKAAQQYSGLHEEERCQ